MPTSVDDVSYEYPSWVKDDVDKAIVEVMMNADLTKTRIQNLVKDKIIKKVTNMSLDEKFDFHISKGHICIDEKTTTLKVLHIKK